MNSSDNIHQYLEARGWVPKNAASIAKSIAIEAGELLEHFQWDNPTFEELKEDPSKLLEVQRELADVVIYSLQMARYLDINVDEMIEDKLTVQDKRYPIGTPQNKEQA